MTEQEEFESREIEKLIERFSSSYQNLVSRVERNTFESELRDASMSLRSYTEEGRSASSSAERQIGEAQNGVSGISRATEQLLQQGSARFQEFCTRQSESTETILSALSSLEEIELPVVRPFYDFYPDENGADLASMLGLGGSAILPEAKPADETVLTVVEGSIPAEEPDLTEEPAPAEVLPAASEQEVND